MFRWQRRETQEYEQKYGISLKSFTWPWHNVTTWHVFPSKQITWPSPKSMGREGYDAIENKYLVFVSSSSHRAPKTLGIYCLLYANKITQREGTLGSIRMGASHQKNQPCEYRVRTFSPTLKGETRVWTSCSVTNVQWFYHLCPCKLLWWGAGTCSVGEYTDVLGGWHAWGGQGSSAPPPPCPMHLYYWAVSVLYPL